jgi:hypothetical protein
MTIIVEQTIIDTAIDTSQEVIVTEINVAELGERGYGVPADGNDGEILVKDGIIPFVTKWIPNTGGGGGISDAPNNANAYVRSGLAWVIGYTKTAIDALLANKVDKATDSRLITSAESTLLGNTSGTNTGDNATNTQYSGLASSKENTANKSVSIVTDQASDVKFPSVKAVYDWAISVFTTTSAVASQITTALTGYATQSYVTSQGYITNVITALGFTPYNATNPSGYQTVSQVQAIADAKVANTITNGVTTSAPNQDTVFDALALKQNTLTDVNFGAFVNSLTDKITLVDADEITSDDSADSSKAKKTSWSNVWALFLKPKTDFFYQPKATVLTNTTASFTTADETKLDKYPSTATNGKMLQGNGTNYVEVDAPTGNTPTEQTYAGTITFSTTAPTTILSNVYIWSQLGKVVTGQFNFNYNLAATNSFVIFTLPADMPTPRNVTGYTSASEIICYGNAMFVASTTATATATRVGLMRRNSANTGYEFLIIHTAAIPVKTISLTISYFTT